MRQPHSPLVSLTTQPANTHGHGHPSLRKYERDAAFVRGGAEAVKNLMKRQVPSAACPQHAHRLPARAAYARGVRWPLPRYPASAPAAPNPQNNTRSQAARSQTRAKPAPLTAASRPAAESRAACAPRRRRSASWSCTARSARRWRNSQHVVSVLRARLRSLA
jgi:hypothetical protein